MVADVLGPVLLQRSDAVAIFSANGGAAFSEICTMIIVKLYIDKSIAWRTADTSNPVLSPAMTATDYIDNIGAKPFQCQHKTHVITI